LWLATENPYAAIVLDVMLPGFDGFELCRRLRAAGVWVPVLMLTARDAVGDRVRGLDVGADDYLVKPFSLLELAARLRALARRDDRARPWFGRGGLEAGPGGKRAGGVVPSRLSPKEFRAGVVLRHPGMVLTRSQILDAAWDFAYDGTSNVVDQYVTYLRKKIDVPFGRHDLRPSGAWVTGCATPSGVRDADPAAGGAGVRLPGGRVRARRLAVCQPAVRRDAEIDGRCAGRAAHPGQPVHRRR
jgi:two-component system OmpR family response regulator